MAYLISHYCYLLFFAITCSQLPHAGSFLMCKELNLAKLSNFSAKSNNTTTSILGLFYTDNKNFSVELLLNPSKLGFQIFIVNPASGLQLWKSSDVPLSRSLLFSLDQNAGSLLLIGDGDSVLWSSRTWGMQVSSLQLNLEVDGKQPLLESEGSRHCKALQQRSRSRQISRILRQKRALMVQEANSRAIIDENGSFHATYTAVIHENGSLNTTFSDVNAPSSSNGSSNSVSYDSTGGHRNKKVLAMEIVFPVLGFFLLLALCLAIILYGRKRKAQAPIVKKSRNSTFIQKSTREQEDEVLLENLAPAGLPPRFTYAEMEEATNGFAKKLGEGGYGQVYEGLLPASGTRIAVKVFLDTESLACRTGFCKEVMSIGEKKHQNLVQLRGYCVEDDHRMLVYELMENGSLSKMLFGAKVRSGADGWTAYLSWERRRAIAMDTARALSFLHEEGEQKRAVIHCDVKPENILLDENWVAKVSDFGLAKLLWGSSRHVEEDDHAHHQKKNSSTHDADGGRHSPSVNHNASSTWPDTGCLSVLISSKGIRGTLGYLAPEWIRLDGGHADSITPASDVYSFGVVLLELVAGRRSMVPGQPFLLGHAFDMLANGDDLATLLDPNILEGVHSGTSFDHLEDVRNIVKVALWCLQEDTTLRPTMANIVTMLTNKQPISLPPFCEYFAGSSHFFDEAHTLPENTFSSNVSMSQQDTSSSTSYEQGSWQISIVSAR